MHAPSHPRRLDVDRSSMRRCARRVTSMATPTIVRAAVTAAAAAHARARVGETASARWVTAGASASTTSPSPRARRPPCAVNDARTFASDAAREDDDAACDGFDAAYWKEQIQNFNASAKPSARALIRRLHDVDPLGVDLTLRGASTRGNSRTARMTLYDYALSVKKQHGRKVLLIRVGEFYEALGFDAAILVMYAGLNPMGTSGVPKAGCPIVKIQETLDRLTSRGYSVVVCEEAPVMVKYGAPTPPKDRFIAAIVTPASPNYVKGAASAGEDVDFGDGSAPPVIGLASSALGYTVVTVEPDLRRVSVLEGLTAESAAARLSAGGIAPPLYRHTSLGGGHAQSGRHAAGTSAPSRRLRWEVQSILSAAEGVDAVKYSGDVVDKLLDMVRIDHGLSPDEPFDRVSVSSKGRPAPLSLATAQQLGILPTRSVPPLLTHLLPERAAPAACRAYLQELLLHPPPPDVALGIQEASVLFARATVGMPQLEVLPPSKVAKLLSQREASHTFFADVASMARGVHDLLTHEHGDIRRAGELLMKPTSLKLGHAIDAGDLANVCAKTCDIIRSVVSEDALDGATSTPASRRRDDDDARGPYAPDDGSDNDEDDDVDDDDMSFVMDGLDRPPTLENIPARFMFENERWRGRVRRDAVAPELARVREASLALEAAINEDLVPVVHASALERKGRARKCEIEHCMRNNALWIRHVAAAARPAEFTHPRDRFGKEVSDRWTTPRVERALNDYRIATHAASVAVADALRNLAEDLHPYVSSLVGAATASTICVAVVAHASHAVNKRWTAPVLLPDGDTASAMSFTNLVPFWMPMDGATTVPNTLDVDGLLILTGPNMAGKSTVLRAVAACALLAQCGLHVPAHAARVPRLDALIVRMSSTDSPSEGLSSFAVEMMEMKSMLSACTPGTLVMVDELGRGTEASHGTAIAGAVLEALDACGARGIFATHLHGILDLPLNASPFTRRARMETAVSSDGSRRPTWRVVPGECRESLALQTALDCGLPPALVARAGVLLEKQASIPLVKLPRADGASVSSVSSSSRSTTVVDAAFLKTILEQSSASALKRDDVRAISVGTNETPPVSSAGQTCVYVLRRGDGWCYCGESDHLPTRLATHRQKSDRLIELVYVAVPKEAGGKSAARALESRVIQALNAARVPLWSDRDAAHKNFGSAG